VRPCAKRLIMQVCQACSYVCSHLNVIVTHKCVVLVQFRNASNRRGIYRTSGLIPTAIARCRCVWGGGAPTIVWELTCKMVLTDRSLSIQHRRFIIVLTK
jgi:hypothetical protein